MAFDILSIPSMSPELERAFSQAKSSSLEKGIGLVERQ